MRGTDSAALASVLGALADAAATGAVTEADTVMQYVKQLVTAIIAEAASTARVLCSMDFWSDLVEEVAVTGTQSTVAITGGNVVVADLPAGATITRAIAMMKFRMVENTYAGVNKLDAASALPMQVDDAGNTGWLTCIDFVDDAFTLAASTREGGDVIISDTDIAARIDANDTYDFQWLNAKADQNNIQFNDVQMGIRLWYSI